MLFPGGVVWFLLGLASSSIVFLVLYFKSKSLHKHHTNLSSAAHVSTLSREAILRLFSQDHGGLPLWLRSPDSNEAAWLNSAMQVLWPFIERAGTEWAFKNENLETLLNSTSFWKPAWLASSGVVLQSLVLGQAPPRVTGVKVYPPHAPGIGPGGTPGALVLDLSFDWISQMQVQIAMKKLDSLTTYSFLDRVLGVIYRTVAVKVVVQDVVARGQLRVVASPLLATLPVVGALRVSFLEPPAISYKVSSFGANPLMIPGLKTWLNSFIEEQVLAPFIFPEGFGINVGELFGVASFAPPVRPEGLLAVTIKRAANVPRLDLFGLSDPYVKLYLSKKFKQQTSIKGKDLFPVWEESFEFLVHDTAHQRLHLELLDFEAFRADVQIGRRVFFPCSCWYYLLSFHIYILGLTFTVGANPHCIALPCRVEVPLTYFDLTPGHVNKITLVIPRTGEGEKRAVPPKNREMPSKKNSMRGSHTGDGKPQVATVVSGDLGTPMPTELIALKENRTHIKKKMMPFKGSSFAKQLGALAKTKDITLDIEVHYLPFTSQEADAAHDAASGCSHERTLSPRLRRLLHGGMLFINLTRAEGLPGSTGVTKKFRIKVKIGPRDGVPVYHKIAERTGIGRGLDARNPIFDSSLDFLVDGELAHRDDAVVAVELWTTHVVLPPSFNGSVIIPLSTVIEQRHLRNSWQLEGAGGGDFYMDLEWLATMGGI